MRILIIVCAIAALSFSGASAADITAQAGVNYDWWDDTAGNKAHQTYVPLQLYVPYKDFSLRLLGGYTSTSRTIAGVGKFSMDTFIDTKLDLSYEIIGKLPVDILVGLDFNLPTGKTKLSEKQLTLIMDPDLVTITTFGEGFDVNPVVTVAKQWGPWSAGIGVGYSWRGDYDYSELITDFTPGDILNVNAEVRYEISPAWTGRLLANYAWYGKQKIKDENSFQQGDLFLVALGFHYSRDKWDGDFDVRGIFRGKDKVLDTAGAVATAPHGYYGDEMVATVSGRYSLTDRTALQGLLQYLYLGANSYPSSSPFHTGERNKLLAGLGVKQQFSTHLEGLLQVKGFLMHDGPNTAEMLFSPTTDRSYKGYTLAAYITGRF
jgi:opacity protein-like surface antigen